MLDLDSPDDKTQVATDQKIFDSDQKVLNKDTSTFNKDSTTLASAQSTLDAFNAKNGTLITQLAQINSDLIAYGIGKTVTFNADSKNPISYTIRGPNPDGGYSSAQDAAQDAIALSFYITSLTGDPYERAGLVHKIGPTDFTYDINVGTFASKDQTLNGIQLVPGQELVAIPMSNDAVAVWHIHPDTPIIMDNGEDSSINQGFSPGDIEGYLKEFNGATIKVNGVSTVIPPHPGFLYFLGGDNGKFVELAGGSSHQVFLQGKGYFSLPHITAHQ